MRIVDEINDVKDNLINRVQGVVGHVMEKNMPERDTSGKCMGECRDRIREGEEERQRTTVSQPYNDPNPDTPEWTRKRNDQPGVFGGRI